MTQVNLNDVAKYLSTYIEEYRLAYDRLTLDAPHGAGYPERKSISTYLDDAPFECLLGTDGWVIVDSAGVPRNENWHIAGGPAMMIDYEPTAVPKEIRQLLIDEGIWGESIGIYRIGTCQAC
jgi:hypothetical protein